MSFMNFVESEIGNSSTTENGAIGYKSALDPFVDMNFKLTSYKENDKNLIKDFEACLKLDPILAMKFMFFIGDIRNGVGLRNIFRQLLFYLANQKNYSNLLLKVISLIPEYNRWDSLIVLLRVPFVVKDVIKIIKSQLDEDAQGVEEKKSISLLAKWMPSINCTNKDQIKLAKKIVRLLHTTDKEYRQLLSKLRAYLNVTETKMSSNNWNEINYSTVPSKANLIYKNAFMKHDKERRGEFLTKVYEGDTKINSATLNPGEMVAKYQYPYKNSEDPTIECLWKNLPRKNDLNIMTVIDTSGSMCMLVNNKSNMLAIHVAVGLGIYCSECASSEYKDKFITFSSKPSFIDLSDCCTLKEKLNKSFYDCDLSNTNIEAVFDLILKIAVDKKLDQKDIPQAVLIISDMEFDSLYSPLGEAKLFENISKKFNSNGYKLPKLVFWNIHSRTNTIPLTSNDNGLVLLSGYSQNLVDLIMSSKFDPKEIILEKLNSDRYKIIDEMLK